MSRDSREGADFDNNSATPQPADRAQDNPPPPGGEGPESSYFEKLIRYIPGELVAAWLSIDGILREDLLSSPLWIYWAVFAAVLALTPLYVIYRPTHSDFMTNHSLRFHAVAAAVAFVVWVFALGGPFAVTFVWYRPIYGSLLLILTTLTIPVFEKVASRLSFFRRR
jgi:hypothetical protein